MSDEQQIREIKENIKRLNDLILYLQTQMNNAIKEYEEVVQKLQKLEDENK